MATPLPRNEPERDTAERVAAWLTLVRPSRLCLAPGDVLVGYALATRGLQPDQITVTTLISLVVISVMLYATRSLLMARFTDSLELSDSPSKKHIIVGCQLLVFVTFTAAFVVLPFGNALMVTGAFFLLFIYVTMLQSVPFVGSLIAGLYHGLLLFIGAASAETTTDVGTNITFIILSAIVLSIFMAASYSLFRDRVSKLPAKSLSLLLATTPILLTLSGLQGLFADGWRCIGVWVLWVLFAGTTWYLCYKLWSVKEAAKAHVLGELFLRNIIIAQAFWIAASGATCFWVGCFLLLWPIAGNLSRRGL